MSSRSIKLLLAFGAVIILGAFLGGGSSPDADNPPLAAVSVPNSADKPIVGTLERTENASLAPSRQAEPVPRVAGAEVWAAPDTVPVLKVIDGDTISVLQDGKSVTVRLIGIDTPETVDPRTTVECFGKEASARAHAVLDGKKVRLETDAAQGFLDKYDRLLAYAFLEDGTNFNQQMISEGYAYEYTYETPYRYQAEFKHAEEQARASARGLWAPGVCDAPSVAPAPAAPPVQAAPAGVNCGANTYNCTDFATHDEAQAVFVACGGAANDVHRLDSDKDGVACESLP